MAANRSPASSFARRALPGGAAIAAVAAALLPAAAAAPSGDALVVDLYLARPEVVGFLPASTTRSIGTDAALERALVAQALSRTQACLGAAAVAYQLVVADRIVVHDGGRVTSFEVADMRPLAGALLLAAGSNPSVLFAGGGPESLAQVLPRAAASYFHQGCSG